MRKVLATFRTANALLERYRTTEPSLEIVYRSLFLKELKQCGVRDEFYPVGGAANHSLLYFIARVLREFRLGHVVEFGAGQSSILIDRLRKATGQNFRVTTVEHDPQWAGHIGAQVDHRVLCRPLAKRRVNGHDIEYYDLDSEALEGPADLLIVDGPPAHERERKFARHGALQFTNALLAKDFVVVVDDAQRDGEVQLFRALKKQLDDRRIAYRESAFRAVKRQCVLAGGDYMPATYF